MAYLTPDSDPTSYACSVVFIPNDEQFIACVTGALEELTFDYNWLKFGILTPEQASAAMVTMFDKFCSSEGLCRMVGEIVPYAGSVSPSAKMLLCQGQSVLRTAYPDLFVVIGTTYGSVDGTHFTLPDLRSTVPIGAGQKPALTNYALGASGGVEGVALSTAQMPAHTHTTVSHSHPVHGHGTGLVPAVLGAMQVSIPAANSTTGVASPNTNSTGSGSSHENRQPYLAINYLIVALP